MKYFGVLATLVLVASCSGDPARLNNFSGLKSGPDEFAMMPTKALKEPPSFKSLPEPTPGEKNVTDLDAKEQVAEALGARVISGAIRPQERGLVAAASRKGLDSDIRSKLASEDETWRKSNRGRLLERLFGVNLYAKAYEPMSLDQHSELLRLRELGIKTPSAPPRH